MAKKKSTLDFIKMKENDEQVSWVVVYDYPMASFAEAGGIDMILVGDSLGMMVLGLAGTPPVTLDTMITHCQAVRRGAPNVFIIGDMPFGTYEISDARAVDNAVRLVKETDCDCVKLEGGVRVKTRIKAVTEAGIPVMGHIGLTPQSSGALGGFKAQGRTVPAARELILDALAVQEAGAFAVLLEAVPPEVTRFVHELLTIPVYSIGAGPYCDGQELLAGDMMGMFRKFTPKFVRRYASVADSVIGGFKEYVDDVRTKKFPTDDYVYHVIDPIEDFNKLFDEYRAKLKK